MSLLQFAVNVSDWCYDVHHIIRLPRVEIFQCDKMAKLLFNVWSFTVIKLCPIA